MQTSSLDGLIGCLHIKKQHRYQSNFLDDQVDCLEIWKKFLDSKTNWLGMKTDCVDSQMENLDSKAKLFTQQEKLSEHPDKPKKCENFMCGNATYKFFQV